MKKVLSVVAAGQHRRYHSDHNCTEIAVYAAGTGVGNCAIDLLF